MSSYTDYLNMSSYGAQPAPPPMFSLGQGTLPGYQMPELTSAKSGFDWGGATATGAMDWTKGAGSQLGTGGFLGEGLKTKGMFDGMFDNFLGKKNLDGTATEGWGGTALGVAGGLMNGYMGMQQLKNSKNAQAQAMDQFNRNFGAQAKLTNASLSDRQERRVADGKLNGRTDVTSVADYMSKYGVA